MSGILIGISNCYLSLILDLEATFPILIHFPSGDMYKLAYMVRLHFLYWRETKLSRYTLVH